MSHGNADLTPRARLRLARGVVDHGWPPARAAMPIRSLLRPASLTRVLASRPSGASGPPLAQVRTECCLGFEQFDHVRRAWRTGRPP